MLSKVWFRALLIFLLGMSVYSFMLKSPFKTMDDRYSIVSNPLIRDTQHIKQIFTKGYFNDRSYYRPLVNLSFMGEYHLFGLEPFFYNLDNLFLHILNAFLVWILVGLLLQNFNLGFWAGLLFVIHPIHSEAVSNIAGRAILLSASFILSAFICFDLYLKRKAPGLLLASILFFSMALLCKESSAVFPGVLFAYLWFKGLKGLELLKTAIKLLWPWALILGVYIFWRHYLDITQIFAWRNSTEYILGFSTFLRSLITDARLFIFPIDLHFDRSQRLFLSFSDAEFMMTVFIWAVVLLWLWISHRQIKPLVWFCAAWAALELLPISQLVTSLGVSPGIISSADHFLYLASVPVFILMVKAVEKIKSFSPAALRFLVGTFLIFLCLMCVEQNIYATNELAMMERSLKIQPNNARLQSSVGFIYATQGKIDQAQKHFILALSQEPWNPRYRISLAQTICDQGRYQECLGMYSQIDNPGPFAKLLKDNIEAAKRRMQEQHERILP